MNHPVDPSAFEKAFTVALKNYQPFRRASRHGEAVNPRQDSFWMIVDGANKLGLFTPELRQKLDPNNTLINAWATAAILPDVDQRKAIISDLKQSLGLG